MNVADVRADLIAEQQALDEIVSALDDGAWMTLTPSPRWTVADQIAHLTYFDATATLAIVDPNRFATQVNEIVAALSLDDDDATDAVTLGEYRAMTPEELLGAWRDGRDRLAAAAAELDDDDRVPWYGPSMGSKSFLTARLMEVWAHGQDIVDAIAADRESSERLRHISQLGFITRGWTYANRGREAPAVAVRVELSAPSGATWTFGPEEADQSVVGPALDFCLVTTQRRHVDDTDLVVIGDDAREWMELAQLFAGPPTDGPRPAGDEKGESS